MLQLVLNDSRGQAAQSYLADKTPFTIGRSASVDIRLDAPGVWELHARIIRDAHSGKLVIERVAEAILLLNGQSVERKVLLPGDEIQLGGARLLVSLSPVQQRSLVPLETLVWAMLGAVIVLEAALIFLPH